MKNLSLLLFLSLLCSCSSSVDFHMPSQRFLSPEASGELLKGSLRVGYHSSQKVVVLANTNTNPVDESSSIGGAAGISLGANLGVWDRIDLYARSYNDSPMVFGAKVQVLGGAGPKEKGLKVSLAAGFGRASKEENNNEIDLTNSEVDSVVNADYDRNDYSAQVGYRFNDRLLLYASVGKAEYETEGTVKQGSSTVLSYSEEGEQTDYSLGCLLSKNTFSIQLEAGLSQGKWIDAGDEESLKYGGTLVLHW